MKKKFQKTLILAFESNSSEASLNCTFFRILAHFAFPELLEDVAVDFDADEDDHDLDEIKCLLWFSKVFQTIRSAQSEKSARCFMKFFSWLSLKGPGKKWYFSSLGVRVIDKDFSISEKCFQFSC